MRRYQPHWPNVKEILLLDILGVAFDPIYMSYTCVQYVIVVSASKSSHFPFAVQAEISEKPGPKK